MQQRTALGEKGKGLREEIHNKMVIAKRRPKMGEDGEQNHRSLQQPKERRGKGMHSSTLIDWEDQNLVKVQGRKRKSDNRGKNKSPKKCQDFERLPRNHGLALE